MILLVLCISLLLIAFVTLPLISSAAPVRTTYTLQATECDVSVTAASVTMTIGSNVNIPTLPTTAHVNISGECRAFMFPSAPCIGDIVEQIGDGTCESADGAITCSIPITSRHQLPLTQFVEFVTGTGYPSSLYSLDVCTTVQFDDNEPFFQNCTPLSC